jgi:O-antigen chain-terminating methyltransferase
MKVKNIFNIVLYKIKIKEFKNKNHIIKREKELNNLPLINYFTFENEFRGSHDLIIKRQKKYVKYFKNCKNVLDIGCGRGEFLELLQRQKISAIGLDIDSDMIRECTKRRLKSYKIDLFDYLLQCSDNYHDGIIALQVVEHLNSRRVQNFVKLCYEKIGENGYVIFETVNPLCPQALSFFWADLTHEKPLVPQVLKHIFLQYGFSKVDIIGRTPILPHVPDFVLNPKDLAVYGDYAIIALK